MSEQNKNRPEQPAKAPTNDPKASRPPAAKPAVGGKPPEKTPVATGPVPPLFRRIDWFTALAAAIVVFFGYYYTLAPEVTLEDSGELAVGSFYAGVPHPPGYPVWTLYTWLFCQLPISNIAWRVALSSAVAGAVSCGLLALIVSRCSSMMIEGIALFKELDKKTESYLCVISGMVAALLLAFNGFMWSQAVIVEVYPFSVLSLMGVLVTLLRWIHAPHQRKYLYWCGFWFGVCFTNHQTLIVAAMGIEIAVLAANIRVGRDLFATNTIIWALGLYAHSHNLMQVFRENPAIYNIFNIVGVGSLVTWLISWWRTGEEKTKWDLQLADYIAMVLFGIWLIVGGFSILPIVFWSIVYFRRIFTTWPTVLLMGGAWALGALFYFYMPIASMTNPPMNWGYPRTKEGFIHAFTRGQYDKTQPIDNIGKFADCAKMYVEGSIEEFTFVYLLIGLAPWLFFNFMQKRERAWLIGSVAMYIMLSALLLYLLNPQTDRQGKEQSRVFFTASHVIVAMGIGYGISLIGAMLSLYYEKYRLWALGFAAVAVSVAIYDIATFEHGITVFQGMLHPVETMAGAWHSFGQVVKLSRYHLLIELFWAVALLLFFWVCTKRAYMPVLLGLFALMPLYPIRAHWEDNEQRNHYFGYWFGHDMFTPPFGLYPEMTRNAILFGGTDPGRFNPTYMIFCESFIPPSKKPIVDLGNGITAGDPNFDRRDVYLITQNALADGTYLAYIRAHYNRSAQIDPPFFVNFFRSAKDEELNRTNAFAKLWVPIDKALTSIGAKIEAERRAKGVYPRNEIITPSVADSQNAFSTYMNDATERLRHDIDHPNEPKRIKPGEQVQVLEGKVSVSGQVAVMSINGLLTKDIFDANPTNEFFVEESFPLDWMFPYLTPFGIIMKINRQQVPEFTQEMVSKDHEFWSKYSERFTGNWITYDTPVKDICDFAERVYHRRDYKGFKGSPMFVRDDNAQKSFSKLRSAIGGLYMFRYNNAKTQPERDRVLKEAEFAFKQAFSFCPYSPEAVYKYVSLLVNLNKVDDAIRVAETCIIFDPENPAMRQLLGNLEDIKRGPGGNAAAMSQAQGSLAAAEAQYRTNPGDLNVAFQLASLYLSMQRTQDAYSVFEQLSARPDANAQTLLSVANAYSQLQNLNGLETTLGRLAKLMPDNPEAWYDLARAQAMLRKNPEALANLKKAVALSNKRKGTDPKAKDLAADAQVNPSFQGLRASPDFSKAVQQEP